MNAWETTVVELFTEIAILEGLISARIDRTRPDDLGELDIAILQVLARTGGMGMSRATMIWSLVEKPGTDDAVTSLIARKYVEEACKPNDEPHLTLTALGQQALSVAFERLVPQFKPALEHVAQDELDSALVTLRDIRRTLDNLPDR
jgi:hypothetical protein